MTKVGILVHSRNLTTIAWEDLVFGQPQHNKLGDFATLVRVLLSLRQDEELACIVLGCDPSWRDGLDGGEYTKKFMVDNFARLIEFPTLKPMLQSLSSKQMAKLRQAIENIVLTPTIKNTRHEIAEAAKLFTEHSAQKVLQISAASHAPRCIKEQSLARSEGVISKDQLWQTIATDMSYDGVTPADVAVIEPLHRLDQPLTLFRPGLSEVIVPYYAMGDEDKKAFIRLVAEFMNSRNPLP